MINETQAKEFALSIEDPKIPDVQKFKMANALDEYFQAEDLKVYKGIKKTFISPTVEGIELDDNVMKGFGASPEEILSIKKSAANTAWVANQEKKPVDSFAFTMPAYRDAYAQQVFKSPKKTVTDDDFYELVSEDYKAQDNAHNLAFSAAARDLTAISAMREFDVGLTGSPVAGRVKDYYDSIGNIHFEYTQKLAPYRTIIDQAAKTIEGFDTKVEGASDAFEKVAESLLPLPPKERLLVINAIGEVGAAAPKEKRAYLEKIIFAMDRETEKAITGTASLAESLFFAGGAVEMSTMNVPDIAKATAEYAQKRRELQVLAGQVRMMAQNKINPIEGNNWWEDTGIGIARMAPLLVATMANSPAAIAVMTGQFRDEATVEAVNAGESLGNAEAIATIAAPIMAGQEFLSNALPLGKIKIPFIDKWLKASTTSIKSAAIRIATRGTIGTGTEITEEIMQTVTPLLTQDLLADWQSEWSIESGISKSDWDERMPKISDIVKGTFGPAFVISFLMAGKISISDVKNSRALMTSPDHMISSGIAPDLANQIAAEGLKGNYNEVDALFRKGFDKGNQATPEQVKEAESKIDVKASNSLEYYNKLRKEFGLGTVSNVGNGKYQFTTPIIKDSKGEITDSGISAQFNSISEANEAQMLHIKNRQASIRKAEQEFITSMNTSLEEKQGLDIALMDFDMFTKTFTELFPSTSAQVEERIKLADQIDGAVEDVSLENSVLESEANDNKNYRILGTNSIEQREGISTGVITLYNGGSLLDLIEESAEIGVKRLMSEPTSRTKLILQIRDVEAKMKERAMQMGQKHMPLIATADDDKVSNMEIIEAFSHIAKSYYVQTAKAVERPTFTSDMPLNLYLGSLQSSIAGMELKDAIDLVGEKTLNILYRASQIKAVYDANGMNQDFIDALEKSVGLNVSNRNADAVVDTAAGLAADAGVSMSMAPVTETVNGDFFSDPDTFYRVVHGDAAFNDIVQSGLVRTNGNNKGGVTIMERLKERPTAFPSFRKGSAAMSYAAENPSHYIITTTDSSMQPSTSGRHSKGSTMFPTDVEGNHLRSLDGSKVDVWKHLGDDQYQRVYSKGNLVDAGVSMSMGRANTAFSTSRAQPADTSNITEMPDGAQLVGPTTFSITAYHGTAHKVDEFRLDKIGTGEGAQTYGWGLYFAGNAKTADVYRRSVSGKHKTGSGNLYTVELLPDEEDFLDWDKPLSEHPQKIQDKLFVEFGKLYDKMQTGGEWYQGLVKDDTDPKTLSEDLARIGIPGLRYLDSGSRLNFRLEYTAGKIRVVNDLTGKYVGLSFEQGDEASAKAYAKMMYDAMPKTRNYVIFDESLVKILEENGQKVDGPTFSISPVTPAQDAEYLELAKNPEKNRTLLQKMVDAAAKAVGVDAFEIREAASYYNYYVKQARKTENYDELENYGEDAYERLVKSGISGETATQLLADIGTGLDEKTALEDAFLSTQIKSADPVTYDKAGNVIPLSQRFNKAKPDINFSMDRADEAFGTSREQPYKDRSGEDAGSPLTDAEIREGIEDEQGTQVESPIEITELDEVLDDPSLPDIPWGDSMTSFSMAPGLSPWKQITREDLKKAGKKAFAFYADRMRVGTYSGIDPTSGINIPLQGGFDFPAQNEMIKNDIAWAVSDEKTVKSMITSAIRTGGYAIIALFSRGNVTGNATFLRAYFEELRWNIKQGKITEQKALDFFHEAKQSAGVKNNAIPSAKGTINKATGEKIPPTPERLKEVEEKREAFAETRWTSLNEVERVLGSLSFKLRGSGFFKTTLNENAKRGVHVAAGIMGKQELVNAGMPDVAKMVELMEEPNFTNLPLGTIVGIVQIDPNQKVQTAVQMGVTPHISYPYVVRGKRVGVFKKQHHIEDFIPLKPKSSRIMEGEAMAATISFSMEKANRKDSLRVLLTKKALTNAALNQASWKDWYSEHKETLDEFFGDSAELFQKILSVTSQASSVKANVGLALKAFGQLMRNEEFDGKLRGEAKSGYLPAVISNLNAIKDNLAAKGRKISNYTAANEGDLSRVVVDRHIARLLFGVDTPSKSQYDKAEKLLTKIANEIGWSPSQVQAALWAHSIVQSGETPESYGAYLKKLESKPLTRKELKNGLIGNQLTRRIGNITRGGNGLPSIGTGRGRYSATSPTFSISRSDFTGRIEQSLRPIFEGSPEAKLKIGMMALKRAQAVAADSLYDVGRPGAAKRKLAEMEASRIKKLAKMTDKTPDWVKKSLEKETTPEQAKAALMKDKLNGWIQMHDAIVSSMPTEIRGTIGSISTLAKLSSDKARLKFIEDRMPKVEKAIEKYLKKGYGERLDKMLEAAAVKGKAGEIPKSKFIVTVQDELNTIIAMSNLSDDETVKEAARYEAEIISAQTAEDAADAFAKAQLLEVFGDLYGKQTTAEEMDVAHEYLKDLMKQGRDARKVLDEARAAEVAKMVEQAKADAFAGAANAATVQAGKDKGKGTTKGMMKGLLRELGSSRFVLSSVFGRSNKTADHFDEQMILGVNAFETRQAARKKGLRDFMRTLYGTKSKIRLDIELEKMETRVERSGVTKMEGEVREKDTKTVEEVERIIKSPSTFGYSAEEAQMWEDEMDAWSNLPTSRKRNLTIDRIKIKGTRIEIPLSQMEAVYMAMALRQPGIIDQQTVHGYDLITQAELDDFMSDKSKNWLAWFGAEYANEYDAANEVFMKLFNTRMPQIQFYAPLLKNHQGNQAALDPLNSNVVSQSVNPGATKSRRGRTSSLRIESALGVYQSHFVQMDYWINMAEHLRDTQAVMLNPEVRAAIQSEHGDEAMQALSSWVQLEMARGVSKGALVMHSSRMMRNIKSGVAMKALAFNIGTSIKTLSSVFYSLGEIPITRWPAAFARGIQHWSRMWDTNIIQNRLELGGTPEIRHILANRGKAPNIVLRLIENALVYGSTPTQYADAVLTSYSAAMVYGDRLAQAEKAGAGDEAAHKYAAREMEIAVSRTAQPNDWSGRSLIENDASGVFNLLSMFSSDPRQKLGLVGEAIMKRQRGGATNEEVARKVLAYWVIPGLMFQVANAVTRSMFKDDDKEWEVDNFIRAALVGPLQGLFLLGAAAEFFIASAVAYAAEKITGEEQDKPRNWRSSTNPLVDISDQFLKSIEKLPEKIEEEDFLGGAWEIMKTGGALSTPFSPAGAAPGVADRVFKDTTTLFYGDEED